MASNQYYEPNSRHHLTVQVKCALLREALNHRVVTPQQFSRLMELQRDR